MQNTCLDLHFKHDEKIKQFFSSTTQIWLFCSQRAKRWDFIKKKLSKSQNMNYCSCSDDFFRFNFWPAIASSQRLSHIFLLVSFNVRTHTETYYFSLIYIFNINFRSLHTNTLGMKFFLRQKKSKRIGSSFWVHK